MKQFKLNEGKYDSLKLEENKEFKKEGEDWIVPKLSQTSEYKPQSKMTKKLAEYFRS